jgi:hypothetical protein
MNEDLEKCPFCGLLVDTPCDEPPPDICEKALEPQNMTFDIDLATGAVATNIYSLPAPTAETCKGTNCTATDGVGHSAECVAEHDAAYAAYADQASPAPTEIRS